MVVQPYRRVRSKIKSWRFTKNKRWEVYCT